jgi:hypothetical protein
MIGEVQATQPQTMASEPVSIFFSYSRKDESLMRELESHLEPLRLSRLIESWHDGCITPGEEWEPQIKENLQKAQIILLLISVNFISSKYCNTVELTQAIKRHKSGNACVIPLILKPCMWQPIPVGGITLGELQALPKNAHPVTLWSDRDEAFENIARSLLKKIEQLRLAQEKAATAEVYQANLQRYRQELLFAVAAKYPLPQTAIAHLTQLEQQLNLKSFDILALHKTILEPAEARYQQNLETLQANRRQKSEDGKNPLLKSDQDNQQKSSGGEEIIRSEFSQWQQIEESEIFDISSKRPTTYTPPPVKNVTKKIGQSSPNQPLHPSTISNTKREAGHILSNQKNPVLSPLQQTIPIQSDSDEDLSSEIFSGNVYEKLKTFLALSEWQNADIETERRILELVNRQNSEIRIGDISQIPLKDLKNIDTLWLKYSNGRFGFSVQKRLWLDFGTPIKYGKSWEHFGQFLGWRRQKALTQRGFDWIKRGVSPLESYEWMVVDELQFNVFAPEGHLPVGPFKIGSIPHYQFLSSLSL